MVLTDEELNQLAIEDALAAYFCQLSLNAIAGTEYGEAMKIRALVNNKVMLILLDNGSSHSFLSSTFLSKVGITALPTATKQVRLANGDTLLSDHWVPKLSWWANGHTL